MEKKSKFWYNNLSPEKKMEALRKQAKKELVIIENGEADNIMDFLKGFAR